MPVAGSWTVRALTGALVLQLCAAGTVAVLRETAARPQALAPAAEQVPPLQPVQQLLAERSRALLARARPAFLATVDPGDAALVAQQGALFDALAQVPLTTWDYRVEPGAAVDEAAGRWAPQVVLATALEGVDPVPALSDRRTELVRREGRWLLGRDEPAGPRQLWDAGPVEVVRAQAGLVLGHLGRTAELQRVAAELDAAVPRVTAVWGAGWSGRAVVVVPDDAAELARLVPAGAALDGLAALAVSSPGAEGRAGDRVLVQPQAFAQLSTTGRRLVLTHEVAHVATRPATGPAVPTWLSEGLADHVGYLGAGVRVPEAAAELRAQVRAGRVPDALPGPEVFRGPTAGPAYEQAWLAVELLVRTHGRQRVLDLYRDLGARTGEDPGRALEDVLVSRLGTTTAELTSAWRADLRRQLG